MKHQNLLINGLSLAAAALTFTLAAQDASPEPRHANGPRGPRADGPPRPHMLAKLDTNGDRVLSAEELSGAPAAILKMDQNQDGQVTRDEWGAAARGPRHQPGTVGTADAAPAQQAPAAPGVPPILSVVDTNQDGVLSADEIAASPRAFIQLDVNQDGQLTADEIRPKNPRGFGGPGPHGRGGPHGPGTGRGFGRGAGGPPVDAPAE